MKEPVLELLLVQATNNLLLIIKTLKNVSLVYSVRMSIPVAFYGHKCWVSLIEFIQEKFLNKQNALVSQQCQVA